MSRVEPGRVSASVGRAMMWSVASRAGRFIIGLATSVMVVRGLGERDYGVLSVVRSVLMFAVLLAGLGTAQSLLKFLPAFRVARAGAAARALVRRVVAVHLLTWAALVIAAFFLRDASGRVFNAPGIGVYVAAGLALALFEILFALAANLLNASYDTARLAMAGLVGHIVYAAALAVALPMGWGVAGVIVAGAVGNAAACALILRGLRAAVAYGDEPAPFLLDDARLWRTAAPFAAVGLLNLVVWRQSETLLLAHFRGPVEAGYFDLAYRLPQTALEFVPGTVWPLVMAGMSEAYARDRNRLARVITRYYRMLFLLCAPLCIGGIVLAGRGVHVLFDEGMAPAAVPAQLFFAIFTVSFFSTPLSMALYVLERTHINLLIYLLLAVINVGLDLLLIPRFGVTGAMIPVAIAILLQPLAYFLAVRRLVPDVSIPVRSIGKCFAGSVFAAAAIPVLVFVPGVTGFILACAVAAVAVAGAYRMLNVLDAEELSALRAAPGPLPAQVARFLSGSARRF